MSEHIHNLLTIQDHVLNPHLLIGIKRINATKPCISVLISGQSEALFYFETVEARDKEFDRVITQWDNLMEPGAEFRSGPWQAAVARLVGAADR